MNTSYIESKQILSKVNDVCIQYGFKASMYADKVFDNQEKQICIRIESTFAGYEPFFIAIFGVKWVALKRTIDESNGERKPSKIAFRKQKMSAVEVIEDVLFNFYCLDDYYRRRYAEFLARDKTKINQIVAK